MSKTKLLSKLYAPTSAFLADYNEAIKGNMPSF